MNEFLMDSSFDDISDPEDVFFINHDLSQAENAHIQLSVNRLEIKLLCGALSDGMERYRSQRKKISRRRMQDVSAIRHIISCGLEYKTKEECMMVVQQRLEQFRTGWFIFRGQSVLRNILVEIMKEHRSGITKELRLELIREMQAHKATQKRYDFVQGDTVEELKREVIQLRKRLEKHEPQRSINSDVSLIQDTGIVGRLKNIFGK